MNRIEADYTKHLGNTKHISEPDEEGFVSKVFKTKRQILPIDEQKKIIEKKKEYFGEYIPETELIETENGEYIIRQKYIEGKTLAETDVLSLSAETLNQLVDLIKKYLQYHKEQGGDMDIMGYQIYEGNICRLGRMLRNFLKISQNFLASTNIMIGEDGRVYMVDVCESNDTRLPGKIKNFCAKPFIKRTISNLEKILQKKINFETDIINKKLMDTLNE